MNLRIPGPTPLPESVRQAMSKRMIGHRGPEFARLHEEIVGGLQQVFQTENEVLLFTSSGTGGMEAAVVNTVSPGDRVLAVSVGAFGQRFADIARTYGADVQILEFPWGQPADPEAIGDALRADPRIQAVLVTHNETSTGVTNDLAAIGDVVRDRDALLLVDGISSVGAIEVQTDAWGCDVVVSGSQKAWMTPPGLALVSVSDSAWQAAERSETPRFYWDFRLMRAYADRGQMPFTPALSIYYGLRQALNLMREEGLQRVLARHRRLAKYLRAGLRNLGLELLADDACASYTVTAVRVPEKIGADRLRESLRTTYDIVIGGGKGKLQGKIVRIGHLGDVRQADLDEVLAGMKAALQGLRG